MRVLRARHMGMCFGVRDAIELAERAAATEPLTVLGELVHNDTVLDGLRARGVRFSADAASATTPQVMITAHGASDRRRAFILEQGFTMVDATCPLVRAAHRSILELARAGYHPVIVGKRDHVEVRGLTGDLDAFDVVLDDRDVEALEPRPRFGLAAQTTQPVARVDRIAALLRARFPGIEVRVVDTVCTPTKRHQQAAIELARLCDAVVVIGGLQSNNTRELVETCREHCRHVLHVSGPDDLRARWFDAVETVGITAGTSTPDEVIDAVEARLNEFAGGQLEWRRSA
jgi:4-hydroxy-3-methylbut-2-en-1-yl diphosphate reductase